MKSKTLQKSVQTLLNYWASENLNYDFVKYVFGRTREIRFLLIAIYVFLNIFITLMFMVTGNKCKDKLTRMQTIVPKTKQIYLQVVSVGMILANFLYIIAFQGVLASDWPTVWATMKGSQTSIPTGTTLYEDEKITFIVKSVNTHY